MLAALYPPRPRREFSAWIKPDPRRLKAAAAWRLVRALCVRYPGRLRILETGIWSASLHVLVLCDAWSTDGGDAPLAMLKVGGELHLVARADGKSWLIGPSAVMHLVPWTLLSQAAEGESGRRERRQAQGLAVKALAAALGL